MSLRLDRHDDIGWRALARTAGVSDDVARILWARAEAEAANDPIKTEQLFIKMLEDASAIDALAAELEEKTDTGSAEPGKSTRVLEQGLDVSPIADAAANDQQVSPTARLRQALASAVYQGESAARKLTGADAKTINEAIKQFTRGGRPNSLFSLDDGPLAQILRLADAMVTLVEHNRADTAGTPLPTSLRTDLETRLGVDFGDLRIHADDKAASEAKKHDALAFARGKDVFFAEGQYDPSSLTGRSLIAHEATHVAQQRDGGSGSGISEPGDAVEQEADRVANAFAAGMAPGAREFAVTQRVGAGTISRKETSNVGNPQCGALMAEVARTSKLILNQIIALLGVQAGEATVIAEADIYAFWSQVLGGADDKARQLTQHIDAACRSALAALTLANESDKSVSNTDAALTHLIRAKEEFASARASLTDERNATIAGAQRGIKLCEITIDLLISAAGGGMAGQAKRVGFSKAGQMGIDAVLRAGLAAGAKATTQHFSGQELDENVLIAAATAALDAVASTWMKGVFQGAAGAPRRLGEDFLRGALAGAAAQVIKELWGAISKALQGKEAPDLVDALMKVVISALMGGVEFHLQPAADAAKRAADLNAAGGRRLAARVAGKKVSAQPISDLLFTRLGVKGGGLQGGLAKEVKDKISEKAIRDLITNASKKTVDAYATFIKTTPEETPAALEGADGVAAKVNELKFAIARYEGEQGNAPAGGVPANDSGTTVSSDNSGPRGQELLQKIDTALKQQPHAYYQSLPLDDLRELGRLTSWIRDARRILELANETGTTGVVLRTKWDVAQFQRIVESSERVIQGAGDKGHIAIQANGHELDYPASKVAANKVVEELRGWLVQIPAELKPASGAGSSSSAAGSKAANKDSSAAVQRKADGAAPNGPEVSAAAHAGVAGTGGRLPHFEAIQRSFGRHDISRIQAHTSSEAAAASTAIGARAYATGDNVAFASSSPDLHTAAHEAAHTIQQRGSVQLKGGVGEAGDTYERHADEVADAVVAGRSAEGLLDGFAPSGGSSASASRAVQREGDGAAATPKEWKFNLAGTAMNLGSRLAKATDNGDGTKTIDIGKAFGPLMLVSAKFKANEAGDRVESATLTASIESGALKGTNGELKVDKDGKVSGKLNVPINAKGMFAKEISIEIDSAGITATAILDPKDLLPAAKDFPIEASQLTLTVKRSTAGAVEVGLTGSATVKIANDVMEGAATLTVHELTVGAAGVTFKAEVKGKIDIKGLAKADAVISYDGEKIKIDSVGSEIPVNLPGIKGTALIEYKAGALSLDSKNLHFTLPVLKPVEFESIHLEKKNISAKLSLKPPGVTVKLPGGASLTFDKSTIEIDGKDVKGDITGTFALGNAGGFSATAEMHYDKGAFGGSVTMNSGAKVKLGGVEVSITDGSKVTIEKGEKLAVSGEIGGTVTIAAIKSAITAKVIFEKGKPLEIEVDANVPISEITDKLGGDLHVKYTKGKGASSFEFDAENVKVMPDPVGGQVVFSKLNGKLKGNEITGSLTAATDTKIKIGKTVVTLMGGTVNLLPGKILDGSLTAATEAGGADVKATVGWKNGEFNWSAEATFDLAELTDKKLLGTVKGAAGSNGAGNFESVGDITFGSPALKGIAITKLSGNKETQTFVASVSASQAINNVLKDVPDVHVETRAVTATVQYNGATKSLSIDGEISGSAKYPKSGDPKIAGDFHLGMSKDTGFTGRLDNVKLKASEYFESKDGTADLTSGEVKLGTATFKVPNVAEGTVNLAEINIKTGQFKVQADVNMTVKALDGVKLGVTMDNKSIEAKLNADSPPINIGFAKLKLGAESTVSLKGKDFYAHIVGSVDAGKIGTGTFDVTYDKKKLAGSAKLNVKKFAMFDPVEVNIKLEDKKISTPPGQPVELVLASEYSSMFAAKAEIEVVENKFKVTGRVSEIKNLGKVSEAFKEGKGATIKYADGKVTMSAAVELGGKVIPELATGSVLRVSYEDNVVSLAGTLKPKDVGPVKFADGSHLSASWTSATKKLDVTGEATASIANLCDASFSVQANAGGGEPAAFRLKGKIEAEKLANKLAKGAVTFGTVAADFGLTIGGGAKTDFNFHLHAGITGIPAAGITNIAAHLDVNYKPGEGIDGELAVTRAKIGDVDVDGKLTVVKNKFSTGQLHIKAGFPMLTVEGTGTITAGELGDMNTTADLKVTPGSGSVLSQFIQSGSIHVDLKKWKLTEAVGQLDIKTPEALPIEDTKIIVSYKPDEGIAAKLVTKFNAPMGKGEKGTFEAGYKRGKGLYAHIEFPIHFPGFQRAMVVGDLDSTGLSAGVELIPKDTRILKKAALKLGYDLNGGGLFIQGSLTLAPTESLEFEVGAKYSQKGGLEILGIDSKDKDATSEEHEIAAWKKKFPTIPLLTIGVASLGLRFSIGVAAGYRMPKIKFETPKMEGGLEALDSGGMPAFTFGGSVAMGAYVSLALSVEVVGEIQLLIATCSAGIGAEIMARLNLELGADVKGRFAPGEGAKLEIDPFVGASLDLIASLIATLYAEVCWFTLVDKKWTLASANFAHIRLPGFRPFKPVGLQFGGPGGTRLTQGLALREDAFDQITEGVKEGGKKTADEESNKDAKEKVTPVLQSFKNAAPQFAELPDGWENGMTAAPVHFSQMFPVGEKEWDYYQDNADTAETIAPALAMSSPTERLAKAVAITARRDPFGAGRLILAWRRAQIAAKGYNPDTGVNVVEEREIVQALILAKYDADLLKAQEDQKKQDEKHAAHVTKQGADYTKATDKAKQTVQQQKAQHDSAVDKSQDKWAEAQTAKATAAKTAEAEGAPVQPAKVEKAPPPPTPPPPAPPKPLAKPAEIPVPAPVPLPAPPENLPAVTMPALPSDPGVSPSAAMSIAPQRKPVEAKSPGAKDPPKGGAPDPKPGTTAGTATQAAGGGGGGPASPGGGASGGAPPAGGGVMTSMPAPGPAVAAGPAGIISQDKTLIAKEAQVTGKAPTGPKGGAAPGGAPAPGGAAPGGAAPKGGAPAPGGAAPGGPAPAGAAPGAPGGAKAPAGPGALDPTVQKVVDAGKTDEEKYKDQLKAQQQKYDGGVVKENKQTEDEKKKLEADAAAAKKKKEDEKNAAAAAAGGAPGAPAALGPDGKPIPPKDIGEIGIKVPLDILGEGHTLYIEKTGAVMVAAPASPIDGKVSEVASGIASAPADIKEQATPHVQMAQAKTNAVSSLAKKAGAGDAAAKDSVLNAQQELATPLKISWSWLKVKADPAVTSGSLEDPLKHPYYTNFKGRVATLSDAGQITCDVTQFAESTWTALCKAVKAAQPQMTDPKAYSDFAKGWLDMKSPEFLKAIAEFDAIGKEIAKAALSKFKTTPSFGFWSKDEGRALAETMGGLTLETSAIGGLMDGLPTLDGKKAGWDPELWGALSKAYATAVVPEVIKGKKINVCVGAGVPAGNIWDAVESVALSHGLEKAGITLESVTTYWGAAAASKADRKELDKTKAVGGKPGSVFSGDRGGAIAAANAHFATLPDAAAAPAAKPVEAPPPPPPAPVVAAPTPPAAPPPAGVQPAPTPPGASPDPAAAKPPVAPPPVAPTVPAPPAVAPTGGPTPPPAAPAPAKPETPPEKLPPAVPTALVGKAATLDHITSELNQSIKKTASGTVIHDSGAGSPAEATKSLLAAHPEAKMDDAGKLSLPAVPNEQANQATSVEQLGLIIATATGVSTVTLTKNSDSFVITGKINPDLVEASGKVKSDVDEFLETYEIMKAKAIQGGVGVTRVAGKVNLAPPTTAKVPVLGPDEKLAGYVVNMVSTPGLEKSQPAFKYGDGAWAGLPEDKKELAAARTGVVMGVNAFEKLGGSKVQANIQASVEALSAPANVSMAALGFSWNPQWKNKKTNAQVEFGAMKGIFAKLNETDQKTVSAQLEDGAAMKAGGTFPYGVWREEVLGSSENKAVIDAVGKIADPVYIFSQDGDGDVAASAKGDDGKNKGVLTVYDEFINNAKTNPLLLIGAYNFDLGWSAGADSRTVQFTQWANKIDLAIRKAIAEIYPLMLYPSEPNSLIKAVDKKMNDGILDIEANKKKLEAILATKPPADGAKQKAEDAPKRTGDIFGVPATEGVTMRENYRGVAPPGSKNDVAFVPGADTSTGADEGSATRGLAVTQAQVEAAAQGQLVRNGTNVLVKPEEHKGPASTMPKDVPDSERADDERTHPMTALNTQSQTNADSLTLSREFGKATRQDGPNGAAVSLGDTAKVTQIFRPVEGAQRDLADDPSLTADSAKIQARLDAVDEQLKIILLQKERSKELTAALQLAADIAKKIITALTADDLKAIWTALNEKFAAIKTAAEEAEKLRVAGEAAAEKVKAAEAAAPTPDASKK